MDTRADVVVWVTVASALCSGCLPVARHETVRTPRMQRTPALIAALCTMLLLLSAVFIIVRTDAC